MRKGQIITIGFLVFVIGFLLSFQKSMKSKSEKIAINQQTASTLQRKPPSKKSDEILTSASSASSDESTLPHKAPLHEPPMNPQGLDDGDSFYYKGYTIVRFRSTQEYDVADELLSIQSTWTEGLTDFLQNEASDQDLTIDDVKRAEAAAYSQVEAELGKISTEVYQKFGEGFAVVSEGALLERRQTADAFYKAQLDAIFTPKNREAFNQLRARYQDLAMSRLKFVPEFIR